MADGKVGFGIIGVGNMGAAHVTFINNLKNTELVAVCDINPAAFDRIKDDVRKKIKCFTDVNEFFKCEGLEAVIIAVPHYDHPDLSIAAMEHGKHIIVEKPIAVHKAEALRLIEAGKKHPELVKSAMFCQRPRAAHRKLKELIDNGEFGKITRINWIITDWFRTQTYYDSGDWRASWSGEGGGVLLNQCPHQLDLFQWFFGMPVSVRASVKLGKYHDIEVEDEVNAYLEYANGAVANFITTTGETPGTNRLEISCDRGRVILENNVISFKRNEVETSKFLRESPLSFATPGCWDCTIPVVADTLPWHQIIIENVANAILKGEKLIAPMEEGLNGLELGNAMLMSGLKDITVKLPLDGDAYAEMLNELIAKSPKKIKKVVDVKEENFNNSF